MERTASAQSPDWFPRLRIVSARAQELAEALRAKWGCDLRHPEGVRWLARVISELQQDAQHDLLAALKSVVRVADRGTVEFDAARAAIAKAEGTP